MNDLVKAKSLSVTPGVAPVAPIPAVPGHWETDYEQVLVAGGTVSYSGEELSFPAGITNLDEAVIWFARHLGISSAQFDPSVQGSPLTKRRSRHRSASTRSPFRRATRAARSAGGCRVFLAFPVFRGLQRLSVLITCWDGTQAAAPLRACSKDGPSFPSAAWSARRWA